MNKLLLVLVASLLFASIFSKKCYDYKLACSNACGLLCSSKYECESSNKYYSTQGSCFDNCDPGDCYPAFCCPGIGGHSSSSTVDEEDSSIDSEDLSYSF
mmetsp:Transcript_745/g.698  ORF Transcript_745/g.698 Transcript_745/m.698 type:complete len:100 (-) Transcript_745:50-349(-)